jgi:Fic family protein
MFRHAWPDIAGAIRTENVDALEPLGDLPPHWRQVRELLLLFDRELEAKMVREPRDAAAAVSLAVWCHMESVRIHPFEDGNGKSARLFMDVILRRHVTGLQRAVRISGALRGRYLEAVQAARQGDTLPFETLVAEQLQLMADAERRKAAIRTRRRSQLRLPW